MKSIINFIEDDDKFVDAIDASEEELITATSYIQLIFYHIRQYIGDEYKISDLHGNSINAIIKEDLDNLTFKEKILMFFGKEFIAGSVALSLLLFGRLIESMSGTGNYILQILGYETIVRNIMFIAALLNIVLNFILIPIYGINGAAFASMISIVFWNIMYIFYIKQKLGFWNLPNLLRLKSGK